MGFGFERVSGQGALLGLRAYIYYVRMQRIQ